MRAEALVVGFVAGLVVGFLVVFGGAGCGAAAVVVCGAVGGATAVVGTATVVVATACGVVVVMTTGDVRSPGAVVDVVFGW